MTTKKLQEWVKWTGYKFDTPPKGKNGFFIKYPGIDYDPLKPTQISGCRLQWIFHDGINVYLDSNLYGVKPFLIDNRNELKTMLDKNL